MAELKAFTIFLACMAGLVLLVPLLYSASRIKVACIKAPPRAMPLPGALGRYSAPTAT